MIYPFQKVLPLSFPGESIDTLTETIPDLGPLHLHICDGIDFTSEHQLPVVHAEVVGPPSELQAFYRLKGLPDLEKKNSFIKMFRKFGAILSPDFSLLTNMLEMQRLWNDFRNKLLAAFYQKWNVPVIASPSWSSDMKNIERYMDGWPHNSIIAINSTGVCRDKRSKHIWLDGYYAMLSILTPSHILRYGGMIEGERCDISTFYTNNNKIG